jgi:tetratricopeptide (TPR) repeat protein
MNFYEEFHKNTWEGKALTLANLGISLSLLKQSKASALSWGAAYELATEHLQDNDIFYWIMGGYGSALLDCQKYEEAIGFAKRAYEWELNKKQPSSALTISHALIALGKQDDAKPYLRACYALIDDAIFEQFPELKMEELKSLLN